MFNLKHKIRIWKLCINFKKHCYGSFFSKKLYSARKTYIPTKHDMLLKEISEASHATITYINNNHIKVWSRSKFTTTFKCDCFINNISYSFSYGIGVLRYKHVFDLIMQLEKSLRNG